MSRCRVVITGPGVVSPVGNCVQDTWTNIFAGKPGIGAITKFDASGFSTRIAGEVKGFDVTACVSVKDARHMDGLHPPWPGRRHPGDGG